MEPSSAEKCTKTAGEDRRLVEIFLQRKRRTLPPGHRQPSGSLVRRGECLHRNGAVGHAQNAGGDRQKEEGQKPRVAGAKEDIKYEEKKKVGDDQHNEKWRDEKERNRHEKGETKGQEETALEYGGGRSGKKERVKIGICEEKDNQENLEDGAEERDVRDKKEIPKFVEGKLQGEREEQRAKLSSRGGWHVEAAETGERLHCMGGQTGEPQMHYLAAARRNSAESKRSNCNKEPSEAQKRGAVDVKMPGNGDELAEKQPDTDQAEKLRLVQACRRKSIKSSRWQQTITAVGVSSDRQGGREEARVTEENPREGQGAKKEEQTQAACTSAITTFSPKGLWPAADASYSVLEVVTSASVSPRARSETREAVGDDAAEPSTANNVVHLRESAKSPSGARIPRKNFALQSGSTILSRSSKAAVDLKEKEGADLQRVCARLRTSEAGSPFLGGFNLDSGALEKKQREEARGFYCFTGEDSMRPFKFEERPESLTSIATTAAMTESPPTPKQSYGKHIRPTFSDVVYSDRGDERTASKPVVKFPLFSHSLSGEELELHKSRSGDLQLQRRHRPLPPKSEHVQQAAGCQKGQQEMLSVPNQEQRQPGQSLLLFLPQQQQQTDSDSSSGWNETLQERGSMPQPMQVQQHHHHSQQQQPQETSAGEQQMPLQLPLDRNNVPVASQEIKRSLHLPPRQRRSPSSSMSPQPSKTRSLLQQERVTSQRQEGALPNDQQHGPPPASEEQLSGASQTAGQQQSIPQPQQRQLLPSPSLVQKKRQCQPEAVQQKRPCSSESHQQQHCFPEFLSDKRAPLPSPKKATSPQALQQRDSLQVSLAKTPTSPPLKRLPTAQHRLPLSFLASEQHPGSSCQSSPSSPLNSLPPPCSLVKLPVEEKPTSLTKEDERIATKQEKKEQVVAPGQTKEERGELVQNQRREDNTSPPELRKWPAAALVEHVAQLHARIASLEEQLRQQAAGPPPQDSDATTTCGTEEEREEAPNKAAGEEGRGSGKGEEKEMKKTKQGKAEESEKNEKQLTPSGECGKSRITEEPKESRPKPEACGTSHVEGAGEANDEEEGEGQGEDEIRERRKQTRREDDGEEKSTYREPLAEEHLRMQKEIEKLQRQLRLANTTADYLQRTLQQRSRAEMEARHRIAVLSSFNRELQSRARELTNYHAQLAFARDAADQGAGGQHAAAGGPKAGAHAAAAAADATAAKTASVTQDSAAVAQSEHPCTRQKASTGSRVSETKPRSEEAACALAVREGDAWLKLAVAADTDAEVADEEQQQQRRYRLEAHVSPVAAAAARERHQTGVWGTTAAAATPAATGQLPPQSRRGAAAATAVSAAAPALTAATWERQGEAVACCGETESKEEKGEGAPAEEEKKQEAKRHREQPEERDTEKEKKKIPFEVCLVYGAVTYTPAAACPVDRRVATFVNSRRNKILFTRLRAGIYLYGRLLVCMRMRDKVSRGAAEEEDVKAADIEVFHRGVSYSLPAFVQHFEESEFAFFRRSYQGSHHSHPAAAASTAADAWRVAAAASTAAAAPTADTSRTTVSVAAAAPAVDPPTTAAAAAVPAVDPPITTAAARGVNQPTAAAARDVDPPTAAAAGLCASDHPQSVAAGVVPSAAAVFRGAPEVSTSFSVLEKEKECLPQRMFYSAEPRRSAASIFFCPAPAAAATTAALPPLPAVQAGSMPHHQRPCLVARSPLRLRGGGDSRACLRMASQQGTEAAATGPDKRAGLHEACQATCMQAASEKPQGTTYSGITRQKETNSSSFSSSSREPSMASHGSTGTACTPQAASQEAKEPRARMQVAGAGCRIPPRRRASDTRHVLLLQPVAAAAAAESLELLLQPQQAAEAVGARQTAAAAALLATGAAQQPPVHQDAAAATLRTTATTQKETAANITAAATPTATAAAPTPTSAAATTAAAKPAATNATGEAEATAAAHIAEAAAAAHVATAAATPSAATTTGTRLATPPAGGLATRGAAAATGDNSCTRRRVFLERPQYREDDKPQDSAAAAGEWQGCPAAAARSPADAVGVKGRCDSVAAKVSGAADGLPPRKTAACAAAAASGKPKGNARASLAHRQKERGLLHFAGTAAPPSSPEVPQKLQQQQLKSPERQQHEQRKPQQKAEQQQVKRPQHAASKGRKASACAGFQKVKISQSKPRLPALPSVASASAAASAAAAAASAAAAAAAAARARRELSALHNVAAAGGAVKSRLSAAPRHRPTAAAAAASFSAAGRFLSSSDSSSKLIPPVNAVLLRPAHALLFSEAPAAGPPTPAAPRATAAAAGRTKTAAALLLPKRLQDSQSNPAAAATANTAASRVASLQQQARPRLRPSSSITLPAAASAAHARPHRPAAAAAAKHARAARNPHAAAKPQAAAPHALAAASSTATAAAKAAAVIAAGGGRRLCQEDHAAATAALQEAESRTPPRASNVWHAALAAARAPAAALHAPHEASSMQYTWPAHAPPTPWSLHAKPPGGAAAAASAAASEEVSRPAAPGPCSWHAALRAPSTAALRQQQSFSCFPEKDSRQLYQQQRTVASRRSSTGGGQAAAAGWERVLGHSVRDGVSCCSGTQPSASRSGGMQPRPAAADAAALYKWQLHAAENTAWQARCSTTDTTPAAGLCSCTQASLQQQFLHSMRKRDRRAAAAVCEAAAPTACSQGKQVQRELWGEPPAAFLHSSRAAAPEAATAARQAEAAAVKPPSSNDSPPPLFSATAAAAPAETAYDASRPSGVRAASAMQLFTSPAHLAPPAALRSAAAAARLRLRGTLLEKTCSHCCRTALDRSSAFPFSSRVRGSSSPTSATAAACLRAATATAAHPASDAPRGAVAARAPPSPRTLAAAAAWPAHAGAALAPPPEEETATMALARHAPVVATRRASAAATLHLRKAAAAAAHKMRAAAATAASRWLQASAEGRQSALRSPKRAASARPLSSPASAASVVDDLDVCCASAAPAVTPVTSAHVGCPSCCCSSSSCSCFSSPDPYIAAEPHAYLDSPRLQECFFAASAAAAAPADALLQHERGCFSSAAAGAAVPRLLASAVALPSTTHMRFASADDDTLHPTKPPLQRSYSHLYVAAAAAACAPPVLFPPAAAAAALSPPSPVSQR